MYHNVFFKLFALVMRFNHVPSLKAILMKGFLTRCIDHYLSAEPSGARGQAAAAMPPRREGKRGGGGAGGGGSRHRRHGVDLAHTAFANDRAPPPAADRWRTGLRGHIALLCNILRLTADAQAPDQFVPQMLHSHHQWNEFLPRLRKDTMDQVVDGIDTLMAHNPELERPVPHVGPANAIDGDPEILKSAAQLLRNDDIDLGSVCMGAARPPGPDSRPRGACGVYLTKSLPHAAPPPWPPPIWRGATRCVRARLHGCHAV